MDTLRALYDIIQSRREEPAENSYTAYLFAQGTDKILKKVGEESAEVIIAAKNGDGSALTNELCDLAYHLLVLMAQSGITPDAVEAELSERRKKLGNLKNMRQTDRNT